jgi:hypothetical protein
MPPRSLLARWFLSGGAILAVAGIVLRRMLPIAMSVPPYAVTALLALVYGVACLIPSRSGGGGKS